MAKWTEEQLQAIEKEGTNIIVSAGAGSGKTAVLTERVIRKLKKGIDIDSLLILTFTKAAAGEMKERIGKSIAKEEELKEQLNKIDSAYITTFDSFALSTVKKYSYLLKIPTNIKVSEASIMTLVKEKLMDEVFEEMYATEDSYFKIFITDFCLKDDRELKEQILKLKEYLKSKEKKQKKKSERSLNLSEKTDLEKIKILIDLTNSNQIDLDKMAELEKNKDEFIELFKETPKTKKKTK